MEVLLKATIKLKQQKNADTFTSIKTPKQNSKNMQMVSDSQRDKLQNMEIIQVISFIEVTMQKLKTFDEKFKLQLDSDLTQQDQ